MLFSFKRSARGAILHYRYVSYCTFIPYVQIKADHTTQKCQISFMAIQLKVKFIELNIN